MNIKYFRYCNLEFLIFILLDYGDLEVWQVINSYRVKVNSYYSM